MIGLNGGQLPDSFLVVPDVGVRFDKTVIEEPQALHEFCDGEINPGNLSSVILFSFQKSVQFGEEWLELFDRFGFSFLESFVTISAIDEGDVFGVKISHDSHSGSKVDLLLGVPAQKFKLS